MKLTFNRKKNISRKSLLWLYFLIIVVLASVLTIIGYLTIFNKTQESQLEEKTIKIKQEELKGLENYNYIGSPIDLNSGLGKKEPFK